MKRQRKDFYSKLSQAGSLMIEAMAVLALISLVTPTLYKKSAERTTELQDINTAAHIRTVMKAVDNYVSANYQNLMEAAENNTDGWSNDIKEIDITEETPEGELDEAGMIQDYLPYGYKFDNLKNFDIPKVALQRQGVSITSFVQLPKKTDIGEMRAARIASMIGSNGGYVSGDGDDAKALGVGGIWGLDSGELDKLGFDAEKGSLVVASSDAINAATSSTIDNEKYLQRTSPADGNEWRNTMITDLYMGGIEDHNDMHAIRGVGQLIIGSTDTSQGEGLVVGDTGAWIEGNLTALGGDFQVLGTDDSISMSLNGIMEASGDGTNDSVKFFGEDLTITGKGTGDTGKIATIYDADIAGNVNLATAEGTTFAVGAEGKYIQTEENMLKLFKNGEDDAALKINMEGEKTTVDIGVKETYVENSMIIGAKSDQTIAVGEGAITPNLNPKLTVTENAHVKGILETKELVTEKINALELHAGGTRENEQRWLNATAEEGVLIQDPDGEKIRMVMSKEETAIYNHNGKDDDMGPAMILGADDAQLRAESVAEVYTSNTAGLVSMQGGAIGLTGKPTDGVLTPSDGTDNYVDINATATNVWDGIFQVAKTSGRETSESDQLATNVFHVNTAGGPNGDGEVYVNAEQLQVTGNPLLSVTPGEVSGGQTSVVEIGGGMLSVANVMDDEGGLVTDNSKLEKQNPILVVDASRYLHTEAELNEDIDRNASVYIRKGVIEVEPNKNEADVGKTIPVTRADSGYGYVEAGRFVSNAQDGGELAQPHFHTDYKEYGTYGTIEEGLYDRYMVNPAYTSVMHDIKLTTRGGARLSDILPDFINKGIYVVNNTYRDDKTIDQIEIGVSSGRVEPTNINEVFSSNSNSLSGDNQWASPFLGVVPAPQCPPGYARVITITPAGFMMSQTGDLVKEEHPRDGVSGLVVDEYSKINDEFARLNRNTTAEELGDSSILSGATIQGITITDSNNNPHKFYYLGHTEDPVVGNNDYRYSPKPLYFQQSTWLKSKVMPAYSGGTNGTFLGWKAIMGFIYPSAFYREVIEFVADGNVENDDGGYYWNVFPVRAQTLEAYATVYCYFDRTDIYKNSTNTNSGNNPKYVDQYDQMSNFRSGNQKPENSEYVKRLNDPTLIYNDPW